MRESTVGTKSIANAQGQYVPNAIGENVAYFIRHYDIDCSANGGKAVVSDVSVVLLEMRTYCNEMPCM